MGLQNTYFLDLTMPSVTSEGSPVTPSTPVMLKCLVNPYCTLKDHRGLWPEVPPMTPHDPT